MIPVDMAFGDGVTVAGALGALHPECGASGGTGAEIKLAPGWGGARAGAGRPRKIASVVISGSGPRWYCIETAARMEHQVVQQIASLGIVAVVPQYVTARRERVAGARRWVERQALVCAFPRFVFAEFDVRAAAWRRIASVRGVRKVLGADAERPLAVPAVQMAWVLAQFGENGVQRRMVEAAEPIKAGAVVEIVGGPMAGWRVTVVRSNGRTVWFDLAGRVASVAQTAVRVCKAYAAPL